MRTTPKPAVNPRRTSDPDRQTDLTLTNPVHGTSCTVKVQTEDGGTIGRRSYARAWERLCPDYGPDNRCECGGVHADPAWLVSPAGPIQVGEAPLYTRCDWLVSRRPARLSGSSLAGRVAYRFGAWLFRAAIPYTAVWSFVILRGLLGVVFSWKFFTVIMLCVSLVTAEYILRAQP